MWEKELIQYKEDHIANIKQLINICSPYSDEAKLRSRFAAIKNKQDYDKLKYDLEKLSEKAKESYPDPIILDYMEQQEKLFKEKRVELLKKCGGMYVVFENGEVLDADEDETALVMRTYQKSSKDRFIKKVSLEEPQPSVRTPYRPISR